MAQNEFLVARMHSPRQVIVLLGPPGSGKGTQGGLLSAIRGIPEISTGDMLRREAQSGTKLGKMIQDLLAGGRLVPDDLVNQAVANRLRQPDCQNGCILDGYPRTVSQARFLDGLLTQLDMAPPVALGFQVNCEEVIARLSRRYNCPACRRSYSVKDGETTTLLCEHDGSPLFRRADDNPASIRERLRLYQVNSASLVNYYRQRNVYHCISAAQSPAEVFEQINNVLDAVLMPLPGSTSTGMAALA